MREVVVVGGGIIGLHVALACVRHGYRVTVIERSPGVRGASLGNAGMIVPSHFIPLAAPGMVALGLKWMWNPESPFYIKPRLSWELITWAARFWLASTAARVERAAPLLRDLHLASREAYARLAEEEDFGLVRRGLLMLCEEQRTLDEEGQVAQRARTLEIPTQVLDARGVAELDPGVTMDVAGGVYYPWDCHLDPERLIGMLERRITAAGGHLVGHTEVTGWRKSGERLAAVQTTRGDFAADEFVLAGGIWSSELVRPLGLRIPLQAGKGYSVTLPHPVELPQLCSILTEARVAVTPMGEALRFGGTMEIAGLSDRIDSRRVAGIIKAAPRYFPKFEPAHFTGVAPWRGLRPCSPDGLPYLGRTAAAPNLVVATGHAMMGVSLASVTGQIVAQILDREPVAYDLQPLDPDRYA